MIKEEKVYLVVENFLKNPNMSLKELSGLPQLEGMSRSSINRYLNDPLVINLFGLDTYKQIKDLLAFKKLEARKKGGLKSFQNNRALKDEAGRFIGSIKAQDDNNIRRKIKHILIFTQLLLENPNLSLEEIASIYNNSNLDKETVTRDYVYDCLSEHEKYNIFSLEVTHKIKELLEKRRILGNQKGALKTNEHRGR